MGFFSNLLHHNSSNNLEQSKKEYLYISIQNNYICFLSIDETKDIGKINYKEDFYLGSFENLTDGENVRDIYSVLDKILKDKKDLLSGKAGVFVTLPSMGNFFKNIEVAKVAPLDMKKLVLAEMKKILPLDFSQVLYAENDLGEINEGKNSFFSVCVQKSIYEGFEKVFKNNGINANFEIEIFSLARLSKRDDEYRAVVFVNIHYTLVVIMHGQIIHEAKILEFGTVEIVKKLVKEVGLSDHEAYGLVNNYQKIVKENMPSSKILSNYFADFSKNLSKIVSVTIFEFEKKYTKYMKDLIVAGVGANDHLLSDLKAEFDKDIEIQYIGEDNLLRYDAENFKAEDLKRYAQCFGLALKHK